MHGGAGDDRFWVGSVTDDAQVKLSGDAGADTFIWERTEAREAAADGTSPILTAVTAMYWPSRTGLIAMTACLTAFLPAPLIPGPLPPRVRRRWLR